MSVPFPFQDLIYLNTPIKVGSGDGSNGVFFETISEPVVIPEYERKRKVILHQMSPTDLGMPGNRVIEAYRTNPNHYDVGFTAHFITPAKLLLMRSWVEPADDTDNNPGYVTVCLGDAVTYLGIMAEDFPKPTNYRYNGRLFCMVEIRIHVLGVTGATIVEG